MPTHSLSPDSRTDDRAVSRFLLPSGSPSAAVGLGVAAIVVVLAFGLLVAKTRAMTAADLRGVEALNALHDGVIGALGSAVYRVFSPVEAVLLTVVIVGVIWARTRDLRLAGTFAATVAVTWISSDVVKMVVRRVRPDHLAFDHHLSVIPVDASYPSGHMVFVATLAVTFALLARGSAYRGLVVVLGAVVVVVVALSLVSDGVHYPSDVTASVVWSLGVTPLVLHLVTRFVIPRTRRSEPVAARKRTLA